MSDDPIRLRDELLDFNDENGAVFMAREDLRERLDRIIRAATRPLDDAWTDVERLLPEGWMFQTGQTVWPEPERRYGAVAHHRHWRPVGWTAEGVEIHPEDHLDAYGSTPLEALTTLARNLTDRADRDDTGSSVSRPTESRSSSTERPDV